MILILRIIIFVFLTILTQIGGLVYLVALLVFRKQNRNYRLKRYGLFIALYLVCTLIIIPLTAPIFGREKIKQTQLIKAHNVFTNLMNRNYVRPELNKALSNISKSLSKAHPNIKVIYLDANFPFVNKFPLLPHLSHNDGKKLDLSLIYSDISSGTLINGKPSISGYGVYEAPRQNEKNQPKRCKSQGNWQYDFPKYMTFGKVNNGIIMFSEEGTRKLIRTIIEQPQIRKIFIEPHLKIRLGLKSNKIRFHGCQAVRHDDHIHIQL